MKYFFAIPLLLLLTQCGSTSSHPSRQPSGSSSGLQEIVNVSAYDPKERQRNGVGYSEYNVSALKANGAKGLIARAGKGGNLDEKTFAFISSADRAGMLAGVYYRVQKHVSPVTQADQLVNRAVALTSRRPRGVQPLLLVGDYDGDLPLSSIIAFMDRVHQRTGVVPVAYLENSQELKLKMRAADRLTKAKLRSAPYWLALYAHDSGAGPIFPAPGTPEGLVKQYQVWSNWTFWQYGGVEWANRRSNPKVYNHGRYRFSRYFGNIDRPVERNVFRGSEAQLLSVWKRHGMARR